MTIINPNISYGHSTGGWMTIPQGIPNCPPGLEYLTSIDQLLVHQKVELLEAFTGFETANKYTVKNTLGQKVYWAVEDTDCCTRNCCGPARPFDMKVLDFYQNEVLHFNRPLRCQSCCFPCCLQELEVSAPPGNVIGMVEQNWSIFTPQFSIKDTSGNTVLRIEGPFCTFSICGDVEFKVGSWHCELEKDFCNNITCFDSCRSSPTMAIRWAKSPSNGLALRGRCLPTQTTLASTSQWTWT